MTYAGETSITINTHLKRLQYVVVVWCLLVGGLLYWWVGTNPCLADLRTSLTV